jgi:hypothetical protein
LPDRYQKLLSSLAFHLLDGHAINPGRSTVGAHFLPGPPQDIGPEDAVIPRMAPSIPAPLGRSVESAGNLRAELEAFLEMIVASFSAV